MDDVPLDYTSDEELLRAVEDLERTGKVVVVFQIVKDSSNSNELNSEKKCQELWYQTHFVSFTSTESTRYLSRWTWEYHSCF